GINIGGRVVTDASVCSGLPLHAPGRDAMDRPPSKTRQTPWAAINAKSCPGPIIHLFSSAPLLMHPAPAPRRPQRRGLGRRLASWHPRKKRRPPTAGDLTARADQQPNPKTRAAGHLLLPTSVRPYSPGFPARASTTPPLPV